MANLIFEQISTTIVRSNRKTISVEIKASGIAVRAPLQMSNAEISHFLESKKKWIEKHIEKTVEQNQRYRLGCILRQCMVSTPNSNPLIPRIIE